MLIRKIAYGYTRVAAWWALRRSMRQRRKFVSASRSTATRWLVIFTRCTMSGCAVGGADFLTNRSATPVRMFWRNATAVLLCSTRSSIVELRRSRRRNNALAFRILNQLFHVGSVHRAARFYYNLAVILWRSPSRLQHWLLRGCQSPWFLAYSRSG